MARRKTIDDIVLQRLCETAQLQRPQTATQIALILMVGIDSVRKAIVRLHKAGLIAPAGQTGLARSHAWTVTPLADSATPPEGRGVSTMTNEEMIESGFTWHVNAIDRENTLRELTRIVEVVTLGSEIGAPQHGQPLFVIIHNCDRIAGQRQDAEVYEVTRSLARQADQGYVRVQLRSPLPPDRHMIPSPLYFPSLFDDGKVSFVQEPAERAS